MSDTQWPRFQVFLQERAGEAHIDVGSVHAPDAEMALFNARDVFVRRPECTHLWVCPAQAIYSKTREELENWLSGDEDASEEGEAEAEEYHVFCKAKSGGTQTQVGTVTASTPEQAMRMAVETYMEELPPFVWWVFPARAVTQSDPADVESDFAPAAEKTFRLSTDFRTHSTMRKIKSGKEKQ